MMFIRSKADCLSERCFTAVFKFPLIISLSLAREELGERLKFQNYVYHKFERIKNGAYLNHVLLHFILHGRNPLVCRVF